MKRPMGAQPRPPVYMQVKDPPLGPGGPKSHPRCDAAGTPAVLRTCSCFASE